MLRFLAHPVPAAMITAAALHLLWVWLIANSGGDLAAQDAWAEFARENPGSAYNLAWYGGMHPVSYSVISPYIMATLGVRTTMMLVGTVSAGLLALLLVRSRAVRQPLWPALYGAFALMGNAVSGRATFALGTMFGLAAVAVVVVWPERWRTASLKHRLPRAALAGLLSALATMASPVAGLFIGVVAAALWLEGRRAASYAIGLPPVGVVLLSSWLFPFSGQQPMNGVSTLLPIACGVSVLLVAPRSWVTVRLGAILYVVGVLLVWLIPSQIGSNMTRLSLVFGGLLLVAIALRVPDRPEDGSFLNGHARTTLLTLAILAMSVWQVATPIYDVVRTKPEAAWNYELAPLIEELESRDADLARVEVVPSRSHREASALAPYVNLARGWNRQADAEENPIFYDDELLTATSYREWLDRWAVHYVVLPDGALDDAAQKEAELIAVGLSYLEGVWSNADWTLYQVKAPTPLAGPPAIVTQFDATEVVLSVTAPGTVLVRIPYSPWLSLVDAYGDPVEGPQSPAPGLPPVNLDGCLSKQEPADPEVQQDSWTLLHAPEAGTYRIAAPYKIPRGTDCPDELLD